MSMYYLLSITAMTLLDLYFLRASIKSKTLRSVTGLLGIVFLLVMAGEYYRELSIFITGIVPPPSYLRARIMLHEGLLFGLLFQEVRFHYEKIRKRKR